VTSDNDRAWAIFVARAILGIVFFVGGLYKVFIWGPIAHARVLFVVPYAKTFLPVWGLWASGTAIPVVELVAGLLVLVGLWTRPSLFILGAILVFVTFGHLLLQSSTSINPFILPRSALLMVVLLAPSDADVLSVDHLLRVRRRPRLART